MNLTQVQGIYFIGLGGIGMSAAVGLAKEQGFRVSGSDSGEVYEPAQSVLAKHSIQYFRGYQREQAEQSGADLFIMSAGESSSNPEVAWLLESQTPYFSFCELLAALAREKLRLVVSGTHGKSTTAGWLGYVLSKIEDSSFMVGAVLQNFNANFHSGSGHYFIFEGDEYKSLWDDPTPKMHYYQADILVLTNLEFDHPDMFQDLEEIKGEFRQLLANLPDDGIVIYNADNQNLAEIVYHEGKRNFGFGMHSQADIQLLGRASDGNGGQVLQLLNRLNPANVCEEKYAIQLPGAMNAYNAMAVITALRALGFRPELVAHHLQEYKGVKRRFEVLTREPITIVDDYAHHPTAVRETLEAARQKYFSDTKYPNETGQMWAIFEPHTYSRTRVTLPELAHSFNAADEVLLAPMYAAREVGQDPGITNEAVRAAIAEHHPHVRLISGKTEAFDIIKAEAKAGDVVVVMAVGSFNRLARELADAFTGTK